MASPLESSPPASMSMQNNNITSWTTPFPVDRDALSQQQSSAHSNPFGPFSDSSFIALVVVSGVVIVACLLCAACSFSKYQRYRVKRQWDKDRSRQRQRAHHRRCRSAEPATSQPPSRANSVLFAIPDDVCSIHSLGAATMRTFEATPNSSICVRSYPRLPPSCCV